MVPRVASGPGESGHPVVDYLLAGGRGPGASPWPCRVEAVLQSGRHTHSGKSLGMAGGSGLLCGFWLRPKMDSLSLLMDRGRPLQPEHGSISLRYAFSISWLCPSISFSSSKSPWGCPIEIFPFALTNLSRRFWAEGSESERTEPC